MKKAGRVFPGFTASALAFFLLAAAACGAEIQIPERIFTPEIRELMREGYPYSIFRVSRGHAEGYARFSGSYGNIPEELWREMISPLAPASVTGLATTRRGECPFCGEPFPGCEMDEEEFFEAPFRAKTGCCGSTVYEREEEMPAGYPARPNHTEKIPHLDGKSRGYRFYVARGYEDDRNNWFSSAGEVWRARQNLLVRTVMPRLASAVFFDGDARAALQLAVILDRLADVVPGYPLYDYRSPHGFAPGRDGEWYLTREEYLSVARPRRHERPFWYHSRRSVDPEWRGMHFDKIPGSGVLGGFTDGIMAHAGFLAACVEIVSERPEVQGWSRARHGSSDAFLERVMDNVIGEYELLCKSFPPSRGHNSLRTWVRGAFPFGILTRNPYFLEEACRIIEHIIVNNYFSDGLAAESSFVYAAMIRTLIDYQWIVEYLKGLDLNERYPLLKRINELGDYPIITLYNVESLHGDSRTRFFASAPRPHSVRRIMSCDPPEPGGEDYGSHEKSLCFPESGLTVLRSGEPGSRLEKIMDFQTVSSSHTHSGQLNLQLFYEGVNLLPDFGYFSLQRFPGSPEFDNYEYNFEKLPLSPPTITFREAYVKQPHSHCTGLVDGFNHRRGPSTFLRFLGGQGLNEPGYSAQFAEADSRAAVGPDIEGGVERFSRQIAALTLPNGRSVALDFFRMKGGSRHEIYWHVPAADAETSLGRPVSLPYPTLQEYTRSLFGEPGRARHYGEADRALRYLNNPFRWTAPPGVWSAEWHIRPSLFEPATAAGRQRYENWQRILHDVHLRMWGFTEGVRASRDEILRARGPWPSGMLEERSRHTDDFAFIDALEFLVLLRASDAAPLESTFVHVLEPRGAGQEPVLSGVERLAPSGRNDSAGAGVRMSVRGVEEGRESSDVFAATTADGGSFRSGDFLLRGRLGTACPGAFSMVLYDGEELRAGDLGVELEPGWRLELVRVKGDLTGDCRESALIVRSDRPLPEDGALAGRMLTVEHAAGDTHTSGYEAGSVRKLEEGLYRIDLAGAPPFIQFKSEAAGVSGSSVYSMDGNRKGAAYGTDGTFNSRRIRFSRSGFESGINFIRGSRVAMDAAPGEDDVRTGDEFVIYTIQPGDEVVIPSHFAMRGEKTPGGALKLDINSTGQAVIMIPGRRKEVLLRSGERTAALEAGHEGDASILKIEPDFLENGRATAIFP